MDIFKSLQEVIQDIEKYHDSFTKPHEVKVGKLMSILGKAINLDDAYCLSLEEAGSLHDVGKLAIPAKILEKPGSLTPFERKVVEMHVELGGKLIQKIKHPVAELASTIIRSHHEAFDGTGYPHNLIGEQIPLEGRLCCICDIYDALRSYRPYRNRLSHENVIQMMQFKGPNGLANKFDSELLEVFANIKDQYVHIYNADPNDDSFVLDPAHR